jgi:hypothetical protein
VRLESSRTGCVRVCTGTRVEFLLLWTSTRWRTESLDKRLTFINTEYETNGLTSYRYGRKWGDVPDHLTSIHTNQMPKT